MFTADAIIDTVQTGKKTFVNTFVTNETAKESMIKFIDAQADYTKKPPRLVWTLLLHFPVKQSNK